MPQSGDFLVEPDKDAEEISQIMKSDESQKGSSKEGSSAEDVGIILKISEKGFGFAKSLSGAWNEEIFLNESRVSSIRVKQSDPEGALVRMSVVKKPDGRCAAAKVSVIDFKDRVVADILLRGMRSIGEDERRVDLAEIRELLPAQPALLPLLLSIRGRLKDSLDIQRSLASKVPEELWHEPPLWPLLDLVPESIRAGVVDFCIKRQPSDVIDCFASWMVRPAVVLGSSGLGALWDLLPERREIVLRAAQYLESFSDAYERAIWARRLIDYLRVSPLFWGEGFDSEEAFLRKWWGQLSESALTSDAVWDESWDNWSGLDEAPLSVVRCIAKRRLCTVAGVIGILDEVAKSTEAKAYFDSAEIFESLEDGDVKLAKVWASGARSGGRLDEDEQEKRDNAVLAQMLTARAAEKCVIRYLRGIGLEVEDTSIGQLSSGSSDWKVMDLKIGGTHGVDVKNCRRTIHGGMRTGRWKVKGFKSDASGKAVTLCGVSSPHTRFDRWRLVVNLKGGWSPSQESRMIVLGFTKVDEVKKLIERFKDVFDLQAPSRSTEVYEMPGWAWDYPAAHYAERNAALCKLQEVVASEGRSLLDRRLRECLPSVLWSLWDMDPPVKERKLSTEQLSFLDLIRKKWLEFSTPGKQGGTVPRLPWLYLFILHAWLRHRASGRALGVEGVMMLFQPSSTNVQSSRPIASAIGIADPAGVIDHLFRILSILDEHVPARQFVGSSSFTLQHNGVLTCVFPDGARKTLVAHCGGVVPKAMVDCGNWPLVYGRNRSCECGRLICDKCDCCTDRNQVPCPHQVERQKKVMSEVENDWLEPQWE